MIFEILTFLVIFLITYSIGDFSNEAIDAKIVFNSNKKRMVKYTKFIFAVKKIKNYPLKYLIKILLFLTVIFNINYLLNLISILRLVLIIVFFLIIFCIFLNFLENYFKKKNIEIEFQNDKIILHLVSLLSDKFRKTMVENIKDNLYKELEDHIEYFNKEKMIFDNFEKKIEDLNLFVNKFKSDYKNYSRLKLCENCIWNKNYVKKNEKFLNEYFLDDKIKNIKILRKSSSLESLNYKKKEKKNNLNINFCRKCKNHCQLKVIKTYDVFKNLKVISHSNL